jgi:hypothetical protein
MGSFLAPRQKKNAANFDRFLAISNFRFLTAPIPGKSRRIKWREKMEGLMRF